MTPSVIIAFAPASVRGVKYCDARAAGGLDERAQMLQQLNALCDRLDIRPQFAPVTQEIVIWIDEQEAGPVRDIVMLRQKYSPSHRLGAGGCC